MISVAVLGAGGHGKGETSRWLLQNTTLAGKWSTSRYAAQTFWLNRHPMSNHGYRSLEEFYDDRRNHRDEWADAIAARNGGDCCTMYRQMRRDGYTLYDGIRQLDELAACHRADIVTHALWVDASVRVGGNDTSLEFDWLDVFRMFGHRACFIGNNDGMAELHVRLQVWAGVRGLLNDNT